MADGTVLVDMLLDRTNYDAGLRGAQSSTNAMVDNLSQKFKQLAVVAATAFSTHAIYAYMKEATMLTARLETMSVVLGIIGKNAGYTSGAMEDYVQSVKAMGITTSAAQDSLTKMAQANLDLSQSSKLARIAQDAAVIGNTNSSAAFERMIWGIKSGQTEILRTMGINVNFEAAYAKLATTLNKSTSSLSEQEKVTARMNAVIVEGTKIQGAYEAAMQTTGKLINSLPRFFEEAKEKIGELFSPALGVAVRALMEGLKGLSDQLEVFIKSGDMAVWAKGFADNLSIVLRGVKDFSGWMITAAKTLYDFREQITSAALIGGFVVLAGMLTGVIAGSIPFLAACTSIAAGITGISASLLILSANPAFIAFSAFVFMVAGLRAAFNAWNESMKGTKEAVYDVDTEFTRLQARVAQMKFKPVDADFGKQLAKEQKEYADSMSISVDKLTAKEKKAIETRTKAAYEGINLAKELKKREDELMKSSPTTDIGKQNKASELQNNKAIQAQIQRKQINALEEESEAFLQKQRIKKQQDEEEKGKQATALKKANAASGLATLQENNKKEQEDSKRNSDIILNQQSEANKLRLAQMKEQGVSEEEIIRATRDFAVNEAEDAAKAQIKQAKLVLDNTIETDLKIAKNKELTSVKYSYDLKTDEKLAELKRNNVFNTAIATANDEKNKKILASNTQTSIAMLALAEKDLNIMLGYYKTIDRYSKESTDTQIQLINLKYQKEIDAAPRLANQKRIPAGEDYFVPEQYENEVKAAQDAADKIVIITKAQGKETQKVKDDAVKGILDAELNYYNIIAPYSQAATDAQIKLWELEAKTLKDVLKNKFDQNAYMEQKIFELKNSKQKQLIDLQMSYIETTKGQFSKEYNDLYAMSVRNKADLIENQVKQANVTGSTTAISPESQKIKDQIELEKQLTTDLQSEYMTRLKDKEIYLRGMGDDEGANKAGEAANRLKEISNATLEIAQTTADAEKQITDSKVQYQFDKENWIANELNKKDIQMLGNKKSFYDQLGGFEDKAYKTELRLIEKRRKENSTLYGEEAANAQASAEKAAASYKKNAEPVKEALGGVSSALENISSLYAQGSEEQKKYHQMAQAFALAQEGIDVAGATIKGVEAVINAMTNGDPYTAVLRAAAVAAVVAGYLAKIGATFGTVSGSDVPAPTAVYGQNTTVFGGVNDQGSESISKTWQLLQDTYTMEDTELTKIYEEMKSLNSNITGIVKEIVAGGINGGFVSPESSEMRKTFESIATGTANLVELGTAGWLTFAAVSPALALTPAGWAVAAAIVVDKILGIGIVDKAIGWLSNGIFGGDITPGGSGISIQKGGTAVYPYQRWTESGGWFSSDKDRYSQGALNEDLTNLFSGPNGIFTTLRNTMIGLAEGLGGDVAFASKSLEDLFGTFEINLAGLDAEGINKKLNEEISRISDNYAKAVLGDLINLYQQVGEGAYETIMRLVVDLVSVSSILEMTGKTMTSIKPAAIDLSESLIKIAGGLDKLQEAASTYYDKFFTDAEKQTRLQGILTDVMAASNLPLMSTRAGYKALVEEVQKAMLAGSEWAKNTYVKMLQMSESADQYYSVLEDNSSAYQDLELELMELQGKAEEALTIRRQRELDVMDESLKTITQMIWLQQDLNDLNERSKAISDWVSSMNRSALAPANSMEAMKVEYDRLYGAATGPGKTSTDTSNFLNFAQEYLTYMKNYGGDYKAIYEEVMGDASDLQTGIDTQIDLAQKQLDELRLIQTSTDLLAGKSLIEDAASVVSGVSTTWQEKLNEESARLYAEPGHTYQVPYQSGIYDDNEQLIGTETLYKEKFDLAWFDAQIAKWKENNPMPMLASGGIHEGGWRMVGEQGPELEFTPPSRIYSNPQTKKMLANLDSASNGQDGGEIHIHIHNETDGREMSEIVAKYIPRSGVLSEAIRRVH